MTIHPDSFAMICFLVLMQNGNGLYDKSPGYITEKTHILTAGTDAFAYLDVHNMGVVMKWCELWGVTPDQKVKEEYERQHQAMYELKAKGFEF